MFYNIIATLAAAWRWLRCRDTVVLMANSQLPDTLSLPPISFGLDVRQPARLETRSTGDVLHGIASGTWREPVARVREFPADSPEQREAKTALPFCMFAGVFSYRENSALVRHAGQIGIDLDDLGGTGAVAVLQAAVADRFCLAAFRSASGSGVRLVFRIPPCSPKTHAIVFEQVALHVRNFYGHEADTGKDVCRASFVSFDNGLWFRGNAELLPIQLQGQLQDDTQRDQGRSRCVSPAVYGGQLAMTCWGWYGRYLANTSPRADGTARTHRSLLDLGKAVALHAERIKEPLTDRIITNAFDAWLAEHARRGVQLRGAADEYRNEFTANVKSAPRKPWFRSAAEKWLRWTRHAEFPHGKSPHEKILFAVRQHCADAKNNEFFLGARDAGLVAGVGFNTAARMLRKLCADGHLEKTTARRQARHAQNYRLKIERLQHQSQRHGEP